MKPLTLLLTTIFLFSSPLVWGEEVRYDDLVYRDGLWYKKFSEDVFSGTVCCEYRGKIVNGKRDGKWTEWLSSGHLWWRKNYKNGQLNGLHEGYYDNGVLFYRGHWKNGEMVGKWEYYKKDGTLNVVRDCDVEDCW